MVDMLVCGLVYLYATSRPNEKRYRLEIWYTHSPRPYLKTGFLFFRESDPEGPQPRKTAVSRGFFAYLLDCIVELCYEIPAIIILAFDVR